MSKPFFRLYEQFSVQGMMPERALLKLKRAGIPLYDIRKPQKDEIRFLVQRADVERVRATYAQQTGTGYTPYAIRSLGAQGVARRLKRAKGRTGFFLGAALFCAIALYAEEMVFGVDFVGSAVYAREARAALAEYGIKEFSRYKSGNEDSVCARLLALSDVEFCSVQKIGRRVVVEMRLDDSLPIKRERGALYATHTGTLTAITVLRGTAVKGVGERVEKGAALVDDEMLYGENERKRVEVIARASIACEYVGEIAAEDERAAFAQAYLAAGISALDEITATDVQGNNGTYLVRITYTAIERMNF